MVPVIELRGAIPYGAANGVDPWLCFAICCIGNLLPVPFILIFIRKILLWMKGTKLFGRFAQWLEQKAQKGASRVMKYASFGLLIFVAIPLPGSGAWTGALIAALLDMRMKYALPSILGGVLIAGILLMAASYGFVGALQWIL